VGIRNNVEVNPDPREIDDVKACLARYAEIYSEKPEDPYKRYLLEAARKLARGAHEDLVFIGEEEAPTPTQKIHIGEPVEGGKTVTFHIPAPQAQPKKKVGPLSRAGGLAAALTESNLSRMAL